MYSDEQQNESLLKGRNAFRTLEKMSYTNYDDFESCRQVLDEKGFVCANVFYEDQEYATIPLSYAKRIRLLDDELYVYRLGDVNQSVSTQSQLSRLPHFEAVLFKILEHEKNLDKLPEGGRELWTRKISMYLGSLYHILFIKRTHKNI